MQGHRGKHHCQSEGRKEQEEGLGHRLYWGFCRKGKAGQVNSLGLAGMSNSGALWAIEVVSNCQVPGPGMI